MIPHMHVMTHIKCAIQFSRMWPTLVLVGKLGCKLCPVTQVVVTSLPIWFGRMVSEESSVASRAQTPTWLRACDLDLCSPLSTVGE